MCEQGGVPQNRVCEQGWETYGPWWSFFWPLGLYIARAVAIAAKE